MNRQIKKVRTQKHFLIASKSVDGDKIRQLESSAELIWNATEDAVTKMIQTTWFALLSLKMLKLALMVTLIGLIALIAQHNHLVKSKVKSVLQAQIAPLDAATYRTQVPEFVIHLIKVLTLVVHTLSISQVVKLLLMPKH